MHALITGGAGFIGSHLAENLLNSGNEVTIIDDLSTGSVKNIDHLFKRPGFKYEFDTAADRQLMMGLVDRADRVYHLAAAVGVKLVVEQPVRTIETNIKLTELVLELCARKKKPVLVASTSEAYGKQTNAKFNEEDDLILGPTSKSRWCYAASKIIDEFLAKAYFKEKGLPTVVTRFFNTIGPRQTGQYGMVVPTFVRQALAGEPITVFGDGTQSRCFTWVGDVVPAVIKLLETYWAYGEVVNIGSEQEITILDLAKKVKQITNSKSEIVYIPYSKAYEAGFEDMHRRVPDLSKARRLIDYTPTKTIDFMIEAVRDFFLAK